MKDCMNSTHSRRFSVDFSRSRRALVQPRFLLAMTAMASALGGISFLANAQTGSAPVKTTSSKPADLMDLPDMVRRVGATGRLARAQAKATKSGGRSAAAVTNGTNVSGFNLNDVDLTPNSPSDEREPLFSPSGGRIVFRSTGADSDGNGKIDSLNGTGLYHIWVMNSDGTDQRQITGLAGNADAARNQTRPSWSPDGNQVVYVDGDGAASQLFVVNALDATPVPQQRTFFAGTKQAPAWSPNGLVITFACNANLDNDATAIAGQFDLFSIDPGGDQGTVQRVTGGTIDPNGNLTDDLNPAYSVVDGTSIYFSSNRDVVTTNNVSSTIVIAGRRIWRSNGAAPTLITNPANRPGFNAADNISDDFPSLSLAGNFLPVLGTSNTTNQANLILGEQLAFQTNSRLNSSDTSLDLNIWGLPISSLTATGSEPSNSMAPMGNTGPYGAFVLTNALSSSSTAQPTVTNGGEDFAPDREPSFGRAVNSPQSVGALAFSSQRRVSPNPAATTQNPTGGNGVTATSDIFSTGTVDTTPPVLVPQTIGNQKFPVVSPLATLAGQGQGNPRTFEAGLRPGAEAGTAGSLKIAVVINERESGLAAMGSVQAIIRDANQVVISGLDQNGNEVGTLSRVNENISVTNAVEIGYKQSNNYSLTAVDDGVNEKQAGAVAGDGVYYCSADVQTPASGEYYIDIVVTDQKLNTFTYDNIWGFSTSAFAKTNTDLLVSDYTVGQAFPSILTTAGAGAQFGDTLEDGRFVNMLPVESYLIKANGQSGNLGVGTTPATPPASQQSTANAFPTADVYRILCRGPVTAALLNTYRPSSVTQIDPNETTFAEGQPLTARTRRVAVASSSVTWASPYSGTVFAGPGTLVDAATQSLLTDFSNAGGRLFVMGRDIGFGLTSGGTVSSSFLNDVLGASWGGDVPTGNGGGTDPGVVITGLAGGFIKNTLSYGSQTTQDRRNLQVPFHYENKNPRTDNWDDAASNLNPNVSSDALSDGSDFTSFTQAVGVQPDELIATNPSGATTQSSYSVAGRVIGLRLSRPVGSVESRSVAFGFGLESINRRYHVPVVGDPFFTLDQRATVVRGVNSYLKTGSISGQVINASTNLPLANFLVRVTRQNDPGQTYLARTDANGNYTISGLAETVEQAGYRVDVGLIDSNGKLVANGTQVGAAAQTSPPGFFAGTPRQNVEVVGGFNTPSINLRPIAIQPGSIRGRVVTTAPGTTTQVAANGLFVLVRSLTESSIFPGGGKFAAVAKTDANGNFSFSGIPALIDLEVLLNPALSDIPATSGLQANFTAPAFTGQFQDGTLSTRSISGTTRPTDGTSVNVVAGLQVPSGGTFFLNDSSPDDLTDTNIPLLLTRFSGTISGKVRVNGIDAPNVKVELRNDAGTVVATTTTDSTGKYAFTGVARGFYTSKATTALGLTGTSKRGELKGAELPRRDIAISAPILSGKVNVRLIGTTTRDIALPRAIVELLNASGASLSPAVTTVANSEGKYTFVVLPNTSYKVRATATLEGTTSTSAVSANINIPNSPTARVTAPNLFIVRYRITGRVLNSAGGAQARAIVELAQGDNTLRSTTAATNGTFSFTNVVAGNYTVRAFASAAAGAAAGSVDVPITISATRVDEVIIRLTGTVTTPPPAGGGGTPTNGNGTDGGGSVTKSFAPNGTYVFSLPYAIDNTLGTLTADEAFGTTVASGNYKLYLFNAAGQVNDLSKDLVQITSGSTVLTRGQGYVLVTGANAVAVQTPTQNAALKSYAGTSFSIPLTWNTSFLSNTSEPNNRNNGYNLIGFPFNPTTYSSVAYATSQVIYGSTTYDSIDAAAAAGIIDRQLYTLNSAGVRTTVDFNNRTLTPFSAVFVHILRKDQNITLVLRNPT